MVFDVILLTILAICMVRGWCKGLLRTLLGLIASIVALAAGILLAWKMEEPMAFFVGWAAVLIVWALIARLIRKSKPVPVLHWFNSLGGLLIGTLKGVVILVALCWCGALFAGEQVEASMLVQLICQR